MSTGFNSRGQIHLIDMQSQPDENYNFILNYQDCATKIIDLKPLTTKQASEVAGQLLDIFLDKGAPNILQNNNETTEFIGEVIKELKLLWSELVIVQGLFHNNTELEAQTCNRDIEAMLLNWCNENNSSQWSLGLKFVKFQFNNSYHSSIGMTPYKALYGCEANIGLKSSYLPVEVLDKLETEEDLLIVLNEQDKFYTHEETNEFDENENDNDIYQYDDEDARSDNCSFNMNQKITNLNGDNKISEQVKRKITNQQDSDNHRSKHRKL